MRSEERTVYVVTEGVYSDYHIVAIFDTREMAEAFIGPYPQSEYAPAEVEEWPLNRTIARPAGMMAYSVRMNRDGAACDVSEPDRDYEYRAEHGVVFLANGTRDTSIIMYVCVFARDKVHARKIANERRLALIAENLWPQDGPNVSIEYRFRGHQIASV